MQYPGGDVETTTATAFPENRAAFTASTIAQGQALVPGDYTVPDLPSTNCALYSALRVLGAHHQVQRERIMCDDLTEDRDRETNQMVQLETRAQKDKAVLDRLWRERAYIQVQSS
jgi:hypothetical protein